MTVPAPAVTLTSGDYTATIVPVGAGLAGLQHRGRQVVVGHDPAELPLGYPGATLVPWPNRITDGTYEYDGETHRVPVNEHETNAALHGLACWSVWDVVAQSDAHVVLELEIAPRYGYPFHLHSRVTYRLDADDGLGVEITTTNIGARTAPYGSSTHPYLTCDLQPVDECVLRAPARSVLTVDDRLRPVSTVPAADAGLALPGDAPLGDTRIDHAYTDLPTGGWTVTLTSAERALQVRLHADAPWLQIYSGELVGRRGVAVEPMTCPPDAFNSGTDLVELATGDSHTLRLRIDAVDV
ncbi:aldose-1-epimerase [Georgenia sp. H159]|uniref:aldose-1-epimerase n=1 Tax=Georgenia sp. H159 TaxID=3076115 RepID=UPI002D76B584|nr:aldose-1-epimerase [Georgenia sp. H159]